MFRVAFAALLSLFVSCLYAKEINVTGSTSMSRIMDVLAEKYNSEYPDTFVAIQGIGSTAGITMVKKGVAEIGMSSRYLTDAEYDESLAVDPIAFDGLAVVVNRANTIHNLSRKQLTDIYLGNINNWKQVGGEDRIIAVVTRESSSGTRYSFESLLGLTKVVNNRLVSNINADNLVVNSNSMVKTIVNHNPQAIGFVSLGSVDRSIKAISFENVEPTSQNIANNKYELSRPFLLFHQKDDITEQGKAFIKYVLSEKGQTLIEDYGYTGIHSSN
ncbi:phosphate ABC transporter substrate-binding protein [Vibrio sp. S9_S30]|uniref:phosphate ABC transporter substrate-binding protein n=1 Tax=Vibrio sp. S9_S30 TaxID=2720226 RepID=UPI00168186D2|nr:phosphate ABC transporter substrate-binding protein [Vibrio sp. S9_S30]MBD1558988.1 phosphate ABC transporter substrate-binding protein [Vibrio sp. S9_S30]